MIALGQRNVREVIVSVIVRLSTHSNAIAPHVVVEHNAAAIMALTTGAGAMPEVIAEEALQEEAVAAFREVVVAASEVAVAGADGGG